MNFLSYKTITRYLVQLVSGKSKKYPMRILMYKENATGTDSFQDSQTVTYNVAGIELILFVWRS
jgi:hypothetical protein